jgi:hypothetical protein
MAANADIDRLQEQEDRLEAIEQLHSAVKSAAEALRMIAEGHPYFARSCATSARKALGAVEPALDRLCDAHRNRKG